MLIRPKLLILLSTSFPLRPSSAFRAARFSRQPLAVFSSYAVSHGPHLPRSVFPKLGFWIREASQFNTQSVVKEGCDEAALSESKDPHPWPEWSKLADLLLEKGFLDREKAAGHDDDSFSVEGLPEEFLKATVACLGFARERPDILRLLSKKNVEAVALSGLPFLFKNGENSASRMRLFLAVEGDNINQELELGKAETVDIMRYLLSYVYGILSLSAGKDLKVEEPVERSVRKLLVELFNLSSTVWKPKSTDATKIEPSSSNGHFSGPHEQFIDSRTGSWTSPKILGQSLDSAENQSKASIKFSNAENVKSMSNQIQVPAEISSQYGGTSYGGTSYGGCNGNSAQRSANLLDKSWSNRLDKPTQTSSISNRPLLNGNTTNCFADSTQPSSNQEYNSWANSNASYSGPTANSSQPPGNSGNSYQSSYRTDIVNSSQPSSGSVSNSSTFNVRPSLNLSQPPINSMNSYNISYSGNSMNSTQPSSTPGSNRNTPYGGSSWNSSEPPSDSWNNRNTSYGGCPTNSTQPSSNSWANSNSSYCGGFTPNSSQPHKSSWNKYNTSYCDRTANSTQPFSDPWANSNSSYGRSAPDSIQPPRDPRNNYSTQYGGYNAKSQESSSSSWSNNNKSSGVFTNSSSQPRSNSVNNYNASHVRCSAALNNSWSHSSTSYSASSENSSLPPRESWNNYKTQYGGHAVKSSEPSNNSGSNNASFGWSTETSQPPYDSWNQHNNNTTNNTKPSTSSWVSSYGSSSSVSSSNSYHGDAAKSTLPSSSSWNNNCTSNDEANLNASHSSSNAWNNNRESWGSGFLQAKSVNGDFPRPAEIHNANACENGSLGYSGKSLEGSCVKEPDPLDMSEEAKTERWFRRVAQIKDIQELSQIPDEDFPQIMPMRKGVNRFVVSKRKTPLERRLASQQYKRDLPVVSSEPEKDHANGEGTT